jgi:hypothetical protein
MASPEAQNSRGMILGVGLLALAIGIYFTLVGLGVLPAPGRQNAPGWIVVCAGLVFALGGMSLLTQFAGRANEQGELPPDAPRWIKPVQQAAGLTIVGLFATIGSWIALLGQADGFGASAPIPVGVTVIRIGFGLGAVVMWLFFFAQLKRTLRQAFGCAAAQGYPGNVPSEPKPQ